MLNLGPFHFTNEISLGIIIQIITFLFIFFKYIWKYAKAVIASHKRTDQLWLKFNGVCDDDPEGWFNRMEAMEKKVNQMWTRLSFNRFALDEHKTRSTDKESD